MDTERAKRMLQRDVNRAFIEYVLLGMALAKPGDRERILANVYMADLKSELVADCLQALRTENGKPIRKTFRKYDATIEDNDVCGTLIKRIEDYGKHERARNVLINALEQEETDIETTLRKALEEVTSTNGLNHNQSA